MKKIYLAFALSIVSVFSILAQTSVQNSEKSAANERVVVTPKFETNAPVADTTSVDATGTNFSGGSDKEKPSAAENVNKAVKEEKKPLSNESAEKTTVKELEKKPDAAEPVKITLAPETVKDFNLGEIEPRTAEKTPGLSALMRPKNLSLGELTTGNASVDGYIEEFSFQYDIDPLLIYAQMSQESSFKAKATSPKGASGFMQLMPDTARRFGVTNIYNPKQNIKAGVKYMRWLLDKFGGDPRLALAGYNAGEGSVMKYGNKIPPYRETQNYVTKIMIHYDSLSNQNSNVALND